MSQNMVQPHVDSFLMPLFGRCIAATTDWAGIRRSGRHITQYFGIFCFAFGEATKQSLLKKEIICKIFSLSIWRQKLAQNFRACFSAQAFYAVPVGKPKPGVTGGGSLSCHPFACCCRGSKDKTNKRPQTSSRHCFFMAGRQQMTGTKPLKSRNNNILALASKKRINIFWAACFCLFLATTGWQLGKFFLAPCAFWPSPLLPPNLFGCLCRATAGFILCCSLPVEERCSPVSPSVFQRWPTWQLLFFLLFKFFLFYSSILDLI